MLVQINRARAEVLKDLLLWLENGMFPFGQLPKATLPHRKENLPEGIEANPRGFALFLFFSCLWMKGPIQSDTAIRMLKGLYEKHPDYFEPSYAKNMDPEEFKKVLSDNQLKSMSKWNAIYWIRNAKILDALWDGNPLMIYEGLSELDPAEIWQLLLERLQRKRLSGFWGFQEKMVSMLTYYFMDVGLIPEFLFPIPVDFHVIRIMVSLGIVELELEQGSNSPYVEEVRSVSRQFLFDYCRDQGIDPLRLCDAIWMFSRSMCSETVSARASVIKSDESGNELRGRKRIVVPIIPNWRSKAHLRAYHKSCGLCPLESTCQVTLRAADYYVRGVVVPVERSSPDVIQVSTVEFELAGLKATAKEAS